MQASVSPPKIILASFMLGLLLIVSQCARRMVHPPVSEATEEPGSEQVMLPSDFNMSSWMKENSEFSGADSAWVIAAGYGPSAILWNEQFLLPQKGDIDIHIMDDQGQQILQIFSGPIEKTHIVVAWNGTMPNGGSVPSGVYRYQVKTADRLYAADGFFENTKGWISGGGAVSPGFDAGAWDYPPTPHGGYRLISANIRDQFLGEIPSGLTIPCEINTAGSVIRIGELRAPLTIPVPEELSLIIRSVIQKTRWEPALKNNRPVLAIVYVPII